MGDIPEFPEDYKNLKTDDCLLIDEPVVKISDFWPRGESYAAIGARTGRLYYVETAPKWPFQPISARVVSLADLDPQLAQKVTWALQALSDPSIVDRWIR